MARTTSLSSRKTCRTLSQESESLREVVDGTLSAVVGILLLLIGRPLGGPPLRFPLWGRLGPRVPGEQSLFPPETHQLAARNWLANPLHLFHGPTRPPSAPTTGDLRLRHYPRHTALDNPHPLHLPSGKNICFWPAARGRAGHGPPNTPTPLRRSSPNRPHTPPSRCGAIPYGPRAAVGPSPARLPYGR